jgi:hypothetical protein
MRRDDDFFKKLKKETPLVKRKDLKPLSPRDFEPRRSSFDLQIEKKAHEPRARQTDKTVRGVLEEKRKSAPRRRPSDKKGTALADGYRQAKKQTPPPAKQELDIFSDNALKTETPDRPRKPEFRPRQPAPVRKPEALRPPIAPKASYMTSEWDEPVAASQKTLSFRHELKFYINYHDYVMLRNAMKALLRPDAYTNEDNTYHIRSLYFDDIYETAVKEKMAGIENRCKYRIRIYNFSDEVIRFEKKIKRGEFVAKKSFLLSRSEYDQIISGEYDFLLHRPEEIAREVYHELKNNMLRPRVFVDYLREAYVSPIENVRITFDKDLKAGLTLTDIFSPDTPVMPMFNDGVMVLEVKFNRFLPEVIRCVINSINTLNRSAISKYVICRKYD